MKKEQLKRKKTSNTRVTNQPAKPAVIAYSAHHAAINSTKEIRKMAEQLGTLEVARRAGITAMSVSRFLSGDTRVYFDVLVKIAAAVGRKFTVELIPEDQLPASLNQRSLPFPT